MFNKTHSKGEILKHYVVVFFLLQGTETILTREKHQNQVFHSILLPRVAKTRTGDKTWAVFVGCYCRL